MESFKSLWPIMLLRGILSIGFGLLVIVYPVLTLSLLMIFFAAYVLVWGAFTMFYAIRQRSIRPGWGISLIEGLIGAIVGLTILLTPKISALMLLYIVSVWAVLTGLAQLWVAIRWRAKVQHDFWLGLSGIIAIFFGIFILVYPHDGILAIAWLLGAYAILSGVVMSILAFKLRKIT